MTTIRSNISTVLNDTGSNEPHPLHPQKVHSAGEAGVHEASGSSTLQLPKSATRDLRSRSRLWGENSSGMDERGHGITEAGSDMGNTFVLKPWWNSCETQDRRWAAFLWSPGQVLKDTSRPQACVVHYKNKKWTMVRCWVLRYEESINSPFDCSLQDDTVVSHEFSGVIDLWSYLTISISIIRICICICIDVITLCLLLIIACQQ